MIFTRRWFSLFLAGLIPIACVGTTFGSIAAIVSIAYYASISVAAWFDLKTAPSGDQLQVTREVMPKLSIGEGSEVILRVRNRASIPADVIVTDSVPQSLERLTGIADNPSPGETGSLSESVPMKVEPNSRLASTYELTPGRRGDHLFGNLYVRIRGKLGLVERVSQFPAEFLVKVYPNLANSARFDLMARRGKLRQMGVRKTRTQGIGRDFESLRDYLPDDEMRRIDWKATARRGKLVSRQYEVERSQAVIIVIDIGRTMLAEINGVQKLDYAIDAALLLAYVAAQADDLIGLLVFSDTVKVFLPPRRGRAQVYEILEHLYNVQASLDESDYQTALSFLQTRWRKRALMVCFTDLWDPDSSRQTIRELSMLQPRHLVAAVTLLDTSILDAANTTAVDVQQVYRKAVALQVLDDRKRAQSALQQRGVLVVDSPADSLSVDLVNRYLQVKDRMMI